MKKKVCSVLTAILICICLFGSFVAAAAPYVTDRAGLLTFDEAQMLRVKAERISDAYDCDVAILTVYGTGSQGIEAFADDYYDANGYGRNSTKDGVLLVIDMAAREWAFTTTGYATAAFTDAGLGLLEDAMISDLSDGYYADAFDAYLNTSEGLLKQAAAGTPYDIGNGSPQSNVSGGFDLMNELKILIFCLVIGFAASLGIMRQKKQENKNVQAKQGAGSYMCRDSLVLRRESDRFTYRNVTFVPIPKNNGVRTGGGGGSTIHVGSSGMSHGGSHGKF